MTDGLSSAERKVILVVEDDREIQYLLRVVLDGEGREVVVAGTGEEGERVLAEREISLVILDLILPDTDGRTFLTRLRARALTANLPVICVSTRTGPAIQAECYALGADSFVEKPFDPELLSSDVALRLQRAEVLERQAHSDGLTGLLNRAGFLDALEEETPGPARALFMAEMDGFRRLSERYGWGTAERIVFEVSRVMRRSLPEPAPLSRWSGSEFAALLPGESLEEAHGVAEELLRAVRKLPIRGPDGESFNVTLSAGLVDEAVADDIEGRLDAAQACLFRARDAGGNGIVTSVSAVEPPSDAPILVAEDDDITAKILTHRLEKEGFDVVHFSNGQDAYKGALQRTSALVILDVKMPGMDGFEVLERLRKTAAYAHVPIILLTSMGSESDVVRGFELGADDYVLKPFSPAELLARVRHLIGRDEAARSEAPASG
jgi:diguanylate cyclase (GGDEF)-like protein